MCLLALALALLPGCRATRQGRDVPVQVAEGFVLGPDDRVWVEIENREGTVDVRADPTLESLTVRAWKCQTKSAADVPSWVSSSLDRVGKGHVVLRLLSAPQEPGAEPVSLRVRVPNLGGVRVVNSGGQVTIRGFRGTLDVQNGVASGRGGNVDARTWFDIASDITVASQSGDVRVDVGKASSAQVHLRGFFEAGVDTADAACVNPLSSARRWTGILNPPINSIGETIEPTARFDIRAENGSTRLLLGREPAPKPPRRTRAPAG